MYNEHINVYHVTKTNQIASFPVYRMCDIYWYVFFFSCTFWEYLPHLAVICGLKFKFC